ARRTRRIADPDPDVRSGALRAARFEDDELPELFEHLEDPSAQVRAAACYAMGRLELDAAAPFLAERLRRGEPAEQAAAAQALRELERCFRADTPESVLILPLDVMAARPVAAFESAVLRLAEDRRPAVRRAALRAAARIPGSRTDVLLLRALADRQPAT